MAIIHLKSVSTQPGTDQYQAFARPGSPASRVGNSLFYVRCRTVTYSVRSQRRRLVRLAALLLSFTANFLPVCGWSPSKRLELFMKSSPLRQFHEFVAQPATFFHRLSPVAFSSQVIAQVAVEVLAVWQLAVGKASQVILRR